MKKKTHVLIYWMEGGSKWEQSCFGKSDLFSCLHDMMKNGYTNFEIKPFKP